jgi:hypothetical protein
LIEREFAANDVKNIKGFISAQQHDAYRIVPGFGFAEGDILTDQDAVARFAV